MASALQYGAPSLITWLPTTSTGNEVALPNPTRKHYTESGCVIGGGSPALITWLPTTSPGNKNALLNPRPKHYTETGCAIGGGSCDPKLPDQIRDRQTKFYLLQSSDNLLSRISLAFHLFSFLFQENRCKTNTSFGPLSPDHVNPPLPCPLHLALISQESARH